VRAEEDVVLDDAILQKATRVDPHAVPDLVSELEYRVGANRDVVAEDVVIAPWPVFSRAPIWTPA
jgi:hypothetical protein